MRFRLLLTRILKFSDRFDHLLANLYNIFFGGNFNPVFCSVNVDVAGKAHYRMQCTDTVADVNCSGCRKLLGWKYIEVPKEETIFLKTGTFLLHLNMLLKWNGTNMQCADYIWTG
ncbi:protein yippee-like 3 [Camellia sinensis]|uniref:protein yippee-like 3 n=1 Tax=Camellia sinensis TaxID=4442 RepID=UPI00103625A6|nr:protein yippee-like 3 [Camellia sinensis]